ncbi:MAG: lamin tail domain-containing protein, partial [Akkermansiaceae bacterium]|nr:lamin tail domain-containing protein [Akkermansiaceae bacterium]
MSRTFPQVASILLSVTIAIPALHAYDSVVVFNEIHYHPSGTDDPGLEFVELYNQNTVNVDLSGWRLSGGVDFDFPSGTVLEGSRYLVVAADPDALEAAAGISGVLGPFTGTLDNGGERLRLRNHNDRIMDEVEYNDRPLWPVGADGGGASLSKISPQTSGALASAWAASLEIGGTPRVANFPSDPEPIVINEVAPSEGAPETFFVELLNEGDDDLDLEGYVIASEEGDEYVLPAGTTVGAGATLSIPENDLGFRTANDDNLYLYLPGKGGLLDAVRADDLGRARLPDGSDELYATGAGIPVTPGEGNPEPPVSPVVINEIMYNHRPTYADAGPPEVLHEASDEEWIELHNTADLPVRVGGWRLAGAVRFEIPEGTLIPEGGYLVIARDAGGFSAKFPGVPVVGDFSGSLSNRGEELFLFDEDGSPADRVYYRDGFPWPEDADGGGSSLELRNPLIDNSVPAAWRASDNSEASEWHQYEFTMRASNPTYSPGIFNFHELRLGLLDSGRILLDDVSVVEDPSGANRELIANGGFRGSTGWLMLGTHKDSRPVADEGERVLSVVATARMNYLNNLIEAGLTSGGTPRQVRSGVTYRVSFRAKWLSGSPQFRFELYYNKLARTVILKQPERHGTPGARNSTSEEDTGPTYRGLRHSPAVPRQDQDIEVSTHAHDPDGISSMTLRWALDGSGFNSVPMELDPDDRLWKGTIPGQALGRIIQFYVQGEDAGPDQMRSFAPAGGARSRALIKVDTSRAHGRKRAIRIIMLQSEANALHVSQDILSNYRLGCTLITDEENIAYDSAIRLRG